MTNINLMEKPAHDSSETTTIGTSVHEDSITANVDDNTVSSQKSYLENSSIDNLNDSVNETYNEMIDFEALIDQTRDNAEINKTLQSIKDFENVLSNFETEGNDIDDVINLDDFFERLDTESSDLQIVEANLTDSDINTEINNVLINNTYMDKTQANKSYSKLGTTSSNNHNIVDTISISSDDEPQINTIDDIDEILENNVNVDNDANITQAIEDVKLDTKTSSGENVAVYDKDLKIIPSNDEIRVNTFNNIDEILEHNNTDNKTNLIQNITHFDTKPSTKDLNDKELDILSISSEHETKSTATNDDGYNSSDFEFITETEAKLDGYIINFRKNNVAHNVRSIKCIDSNNNDEACSSQAIRDHASISDSDENASDNAIDLLEDYRQNHVIPEGDRYLDLFQGPFNPVLPMSDILILENKSVRPSAMNMMYEGVGFERQLRRRVEDRFEEHYADEANESKRKILSMYPGENRKLRRRI